MSRSKSVFKVLPFLMIIGLFFACLPAARAFAGGGLLPTSDQEKIDAYLQARMRIANIPGLALGVVRGDKLVYLKGYGVAGPDGRPVTPQTPFILCSTSSATIQILGKIHLNPLST